MGGNFRVLNFEMDVILFFEGEKENGKGQLDKNRFHKTFSIFWQFNDSH